MNIILPGLYRPKNNLNDKPAGLIHIIGENNKLDDFFDIKNRPNPMHESELLKNYVYFGPGIEPNSKQKLIKEKIIESLNETNFDDVKEPVLHVDNLNYQNDVVENEIEATKPKEIKNITTKGDIFLDQIKTKSRITQPKQIKVLVSINYDVEKIRNMCGILDLDFESTVKKLINFDNIIIEENSKNELPETQNKEVKQVTPKINKKDEKDEKLIDALDSISLLRKKIMNEK